ncbi:MAG: NAD-dependent epimerase/dehydratase family protein [Proteobacteria bacterium]|nr:NAD-dependent epimerase/dehydratase family protein [Pseudomonadota bacterium]
MDLQDNEGGGRLAAVTGVTGFIGGHLAGELTRRGWRLRVLARSMPRFPGPRFPGPRLHGLAGPPVEVVQGSLSDPRALRDLVEGADAILHLAGAIKGSNRNDFMAANAEGTAALAEAWRAHAPEARFLYLSSMAAREPGLSHYAASKHAAEQRLRDIGAGAEWSILRPAVVYGPGDRETLRIFRAASGPVQPMLNSADARLTLIHVADLVRAMAAMLAAGLAPGCHEVTDARHDGYSWDELARAAAAALGRAAHPLQVPKGIIRALGLAGDVAALGGVAGMLTSQKVREILHRDWRSDPAGQPPASRWRPEITLDQGFAEAVAWYRAAGWLRH